MRGPVKYTYAESDVDCDITNRKSVRNLDPLPGLEPATIRGGGTDSCSNKEDEVEEPAILTAMMLKDMGQDSPFFDSRPPLPLTPFDASEIELGSLLGEGEYGTVREVRQLAVTGALQSWKKGNPSVPSQLRSSTFGRMFDKESWKEKDRKDGITLSNLEKTRFAMKELHFKGGRARYAVKIVRESLTGEDWIDAAIDLAAEAMFLSSIAHPNIIRLRGAAGIPGDPSFAVLMDRLYLTLEEKVEEWKKEQGGRRFFGMNKFGSENIPERMMQAYDICRALNFLHHHNIVYRDLKPANLGFDVHGHIRLFDFGIAKELKKGDLVDEGRYKLTPMTGTRRWMAPEVILAYPYGLKVDTYAFGLLLWYLCTLQLPYGEKITTSQHLNRVVINKRRPRISSFIPSSIRGLIRDCWDDDPENRPVLDKVARLLAREVSSRHSSEDQSTVLQRSRYLRASSIKSMRNAFEAASTSPKPPGDRSSNFIRNKPNTVEESDEPKIEEQAPVKARAKPGTTNSSTRNKSKTLWKKRRMFGSAIECLMPSTWNDVSSSLIDGDMPVNNQELWQDDGAGVFVKAEIRRLLQGKDERVVMSLFFQEIGEDLGMEEEYRDFKVTGIDCEVTVKGLPPKSKVSFAKGSFPIQAESSGRLMTLYVELCIIRLPATDTDLIVSLSTSTTYVASGDNGISNTFSNFIRSFRAINWKVVSWKDWDVQ